MLLLLCATTQTHRCMQEAGRQGRWTDIAHIQCTWNGIEVHPELSAKGGGKGAVRSMRYLQFIAAMGIQMGNGCHRGWRADFGQRSGEKGWVKNRWSRLGDTRKHWVRGLGVGASKETPVMVRFRVYGLIFVAVSGAAAGSAAVCATHFASNLNANQFAAFHAPPATVLRATAAMCPVLAIETNPPTENIEAHNSNKQSRQELWKGRKGMLHRGPNACWRQKAKWNNNQSQGK